MYRPNVKRPNLKALAEERKRINAMHCIIKTDTADVKEFALPHHVVTRGVFERPPYARLLAQNKKIWELRGTKTNVRGLVGIIESGTGKIIGVMNIVNCRQTTLEEIRENPDKHHADDAALNKMDYAQWYIWEINGAIEFSRPVPISKKTGCVIWRNLAKFEINGVFIECSAKLAK